MSSLSSSGFIEDLRSEIAGQPPEERVALVFLHGFNTSFDEAARRAAAIGFPLKIPFTAFFSWPSSSETSPTGYRADLRSVEASENEIAAFLLRVAHSMGNYGLLRALYRPLFQAALNGVFPPMPKIDGMDKIDVSRADLSAIGHAYVAEEVEVLDDIATTIHQNKSPGERGLAEERDARSGDVCWRLK